MMLEVAFNMMDKDGDGLIDMQINFDEFMALAEDKEYLENEFLDDDELIDIADQGEDEEA